MAVRGDAIMQGMCMGAWSPESTVGGRVHPPPATLPRDLSAFGFFDIPELDRGDLRMRSDAWSPPAFDAVGSATTTRATAATRNVALDYVRATALVLMCLVHMWQRMLRWSGADVAFLVIGEAAPCLFFVAFGMTQHLLVRRSAARKREYLLVLGVVALLHCYFMTLFLRWEFFTFLWASAVLVLIGDSLHMGRRAFLALAGAGALLNI